MVSTIEEITQEKATSIVIEETLKTQPFIPQPPEIIVKKTGIEKSRVDLSLTTNRERIQIHIHPQSLSIEDRLQNTTHRIFYIFQNLSVDELKDYIPKAIPYQTNNAYSIRELELYQYNYLFTQKKKEEIYSLIKEMHRSFK